MSRIVPTPFSAEEDPQFMDHYSTLSSVPQHLVIVILFLAILAGIVILRDMLKTAEGDSQFQG